MKNFILVLNGSAVASYRSLLVANTNFDLWVGKISVEKDCLELWSRDEGLVREL